MGSHLVISQVSKCLCVRFVCLNRVIGLYTGPVGWLDPHWSASQTHTCRKKKSPYRIIPWAAWTGRLYRSREKQDHPGLHHENTHSFHHNINIHGSPAFVTNAHIPTCKYLRMLAHANSKANNGAVDPLPPRTNTQTDTWYVLVFVRPWQWTSTAASQSAPRTENKRKFLK